jgi:hypothetical protein
MFNMIGFVPASMLKLNAAFIKTSKRLDNLKYVA